MSAFTEQGYTQMAKVFAVGEVSGKIGAIARQLTDLIAELENDGAPSGIVEALKAARRQCVHADADTGVWAEKLIKQLQA